MVAKSTPHLMGRALCEYVKLRENFMGPVDTDHLQKELADALVELVGKCTTSAALATNIVRVAAEEYVKPPIKRPRKNKSA